GERQRSALPVRAVDDDQVGGEVCERCFQPELGEVIALAFAVAEVAGSGDDTQVLVPTARYGEVFGPSDRVILRTEDRADVQPLPRRLGTQPLCRGRAGVQVDQDDSARGDGSDRMDAIFGVRLPALVAFGRDHRHADGGCRLLDAARLGVDHPRLHAVHSIYLPIYLSRYLGRYVDIWIST